MRMAANQGCSLDTGLALNVGGRARSLLGRAVLPMAIITVASLPLSGSAAETTTGLWTLPSGATDSSKSLGTTLPSGLGVRVDLSGGADTVIFQPQGTGQGLADTSGTAAMYYPASMPLGSGAVGISTNPNFLTTRCALNAQTQSGSLRPCGRLTITFAHPVRNPRFHVAGLGGGSPVPGYKVSAGHNLVTVGHVFNTTAPAAARVNMSVGTTSFQRSSAAGAGASCSGENPTAVCGSAATTLTAAVIPVDIGVYYDGGTTASQASNDGYRMRWSVDNDFGDAPANYDQGRPASHVLSDLALGTGGLVTPEFAETIISVNGQASPYSAASGAAGDADNAFSAALPTAAGGTSYSITVPVSNVSKLARLCGYMDFNRDQDFADAGEMACTTVAAGATSAPLTWSVPVNVSAGASYMRLRLGYTAAQVQSPVGAADSGEVEDYAVTLVAAPPPFAACPTGAFVTSKVGGVGATGLYTMDIATGNMTLLGTNTTIAEVNGAGFRQADGYLWAWGNPSAQRRLVRIGTGGAADVPFATQPVFAAGLVTSAPALDATTQVYNADVQPNTGYYVASVNNYLYFMDVSTNTVVKVVQPSPADGLSDTTDMAFHPNDGYLYSVVKTSRKVIRIDPNTGSITPLNVTLPAGNSGGWGAIFFDSQGTMYAYNSSIGTTGAVDRIFNVGAGDTGTLLTDRLSSTAPTSSNLDGARCSAAPAPAVPPAIVLRKTTTGSVGGAFGFSLTNTKVASGTVTTTVAGTPVQVEGDADTTNGLSPFQVTTTGQPVVITESTLPAGWKLTAASCKNSAGTAVGSLSGAAYTLPSTANGELYECDFTNAQMQADLSISKTNNATSVVKGGTAQYTIVVKNAGPDAADGSVIQDSIPSTLTCTGPVTCTSSATAGNCPVAITVAGLNAGIVLTPLPNGDTWTIKMNCSVN